MRKQRRLRASLHAPHTQASEVWQRSPLPCLLPAWSPLTAGGGCGQGELSWKHTLPFGNSPRNCLRHSHSLMPKFCTSWENRTWKDDLPVGEPQ